MRSDSEYREEIEAHIDLETHANIERGMSPEEARLAAMRAFGGVESTRQRLREGRTTYGLTTLLQDGRYGLRMIARNRLLSCSVVLTLTAGLGVTTGVFGFLNPLVFKPVVADDPSSFALSPRTSVTADEYEALRDGARTFRELAAFSARGQQWATVGVGRGEAVGTTLVSCNFFAVFRAAALAGRLLDDADCTSLRPVMVLAERLWRARFASDPSIVGKTVTYGEHLVTIVGVVRASPTEPRIIAFNTDAWAPLHLSVRPGQAAERPWLALAGRLNPGYSRSAATTELETMARQFDRSGQPPVLMRFTDGSMWAEQEEMRWWAALILALPTLLMLVASVNVATLLLGRSAARRQEVAIRLALGASRTRLVRMLLTEHFLLAGIAALASLLIAYWVPPIAFQFLAGSSASRMPDFTPDWRVFAYLLMCVVAAAAASGVVPALESLNLRLADSLRGRPFARRHRRMSRIRVGVQVGLSIAPLVVIAMFARAEYGLTDPGLETRQVVIGFLPQEQRDPAVRRVLTERIAALPGVRSVAYSRDIPLVVQNVEEMDIGPTRDDSVQIHQDAVSPGYFRTMGIPIVAGREFLDSDLHRASGIKPAVVSETFARRFLSGGSPIGRMVSLWIGRFEVVGVARDRHRGLLPPSADNALVYVLNPEEDSIVLVRFDGELAGLAPQLRAVLASATASGVSLESLQTYMDTELMFFRRLEALIAVLGAVFVVLSVVGAFGVVAFSAIQRRKEVAIRLALGASRGDALRAILRSGLRPIPIGVAGGLLLTWGGLKAAAAQGMLRGIEVQDPLPYVLASALMVVVVLAAMVMPAHAAATSHPLDALREE
jgi:predicted permease